MKLTRYRLLAAFLLVFSVCFSQKPESCNDIVLKSLKAIREVKGLKYHLKITERGKKG
jgi:hypothetical protein